MPFTEAKPTLIAVTKYQMITPDSITPNDFYKESSKNPKLSVIQAHRLHMALASTDIASDV